jgi:hypothetical protein
LYLALVYESEFSQNLVELIIGDSSSESRVCFSSRIEDPRPGGHASLGEKGGLHQVVSEHRFLIFVAESR